MSRSSNQPQLLFLGCFPSREAIHSLAYRFLEAELQRLPLFRVQLWGQLHSFGWKWCLGKKWGHTCGELIRPYQIHVNLLKIFRCMNSVFEPMEWECVVRKVHYLRETFCFPSCWQVAFKGTSCRGADPFGWTIEGLCVLYCFTGWRASMMETQELLRTIWWDSSV